MRCTSPTAASVSNTPPQSDKRNSRPAGERHGAGDMSAPAAPLATERPPIWNDPFWRGLASQILLAAGVAFIVIEATINACDNMHARGIPTDLSVWKLP